MNVNAIQKRQILPFNIVAHLAGITLSSLKNMKRFGVGWDGIFQFYYTEFNGIFTKGEKSHKLNLVE